MDQMQFERGDKEGGFKMKLSNNRIKKVALVVIILCLSFFVASDAMSLFKSKATKNKEVVVALFNEFFIEKNVEAIDKYIGPVYIQHNPMAADGPEALRGFFQGFWKNFPNPSYSLKRVIAEGDLVAIHYHFKMKEEDRGFAVVDIFRLEKGKIVEHWDVLQAVPEKSANENTMF